MAIAATNVSVGATEVSLAAAASGPTKVKPLYNSMIYVGPTGVTPDSGYPVIGEFETDLGTGEELFGITDGPTVNVRIFTNPSG